jgi:hypothetical protein
LGYEKQSQKSICERNKELDRVILLKVKTNSRKERREINKQLTKKKDVTVEVSA